MCLLCASCASSTGASSKFCCAQKSNKCGRVGLRGLCATKRCYVQVMCQGYVPFWKVMCHSPLELCATSFSLKHDENPSRYLCAGYVPKLAQGATGHCPECGKHVEVVMCRLCATFLPQVGQPLCALEPERQAREALRQITASGLAHQRHREEQRPTPQGTWRHLSQKPREIIRHCAKTGHEPKDFDLKLCGRT